jgi:hypothetical protein
MKGVRVTNSNHKYYFMVQSVILLTCFLVAQPAYAGNNNESSKRIEVQQEKVENLLAKASFVEKSLIFMNKKNPDLGLVNDIRIMHDIVTAIKKDIEMSRREGFSGSTVLRSHTVEQLGRLGMSKFSATFGLEDFATAISKHIGSGQADIDTITYYFDGFAKACVSLVVLKLGGDLKSAGFYEAIAGEGIKHLREETLPVFKKGVLAWRRQGTQLARQWLRLQERRLYDGQLAEKITDVYGENTLRENGLTKREIHQLDAIAHNLNQRVIRMKKDISIEKIDTFRQTGEIELGGVYIDPELIYAGRGGKELKEEVLRARPSGDSLSWDIEIPEEEQ